MTEARDQDEQRPTADEAGIVDQQDAALEAIEEIENPDGDDGAAGQGEAPTG
jgi:hypothetical protein